MGTPIKVCPKQDAFYENFDKIFSKEPKVSPIKIVAEISGGTLAKPTFVSVETQTITEAKERILEMLNDLLTDLAKVKGEN